NYGQLNTVERILLAQRIKGERPHTNRFVSETFSLLPPNVDRFIHLFDTAVQRSAMETNDPVAVATRAALSANGVTRFMREAAEAAAQPPAPMAAPLPAANKPADKLAQDLAKSMERQAGEM